jgi:hypothetical protein
MERNWTWELLGGNIFVYTDLLLNKHEALDAFWTSLDAGTKEKLETPITLILKDSNAEAFFSVLSQQTGLIIIPKDIKDRISVEYNKAPAINILKIMAKSSGWKYTKGDGYILVTPAYRVNAQVIQTNLKNKDLKTTSRTLVFTCPSYEQALKQIEELKPKGYSNITIENRDQEYCVNVTETVPVDEAKQLMEIMRLQEKALSEDMVKEERDKKQPENISKKDDKLKNQILVECKILKLTDSVEKSIKDSIEEYVQNQMPIPADVLEKWLGSKGVELSMMPRLAINDGDVGTCQIVKEQPTEILFSMSITPTAQDDRFILLKKITTTMLIGNNLKVANMENIKLERGKTHAIVSMSVKNETHVQLLSADFIK